MVGQFPARSANMRLSRVVVIRNMFTAVFLGLIVYGTARAEETKIYKHIDKDGNVTYTQLPPTTSTGVKKLHIQPAYRGKGGNSSSVSPNDNPNVYSQDERRYQARQALLQRQQQMEDARKKQLADLEAECNRNRHVDCGNPNTLRDIESMNNPRSNILRGR